MQFQTRNLQDPPLIHINPLYTRWKLQKLEVIYFQAWGPGQQNRLRRGHASGTGKTIREAHLTDLRLWCDHLKKQCFCSSRLEDVVLQKDCNLCEKTCGSLRLEDQAIKHQDSNKTSASILLVHTYDTIPVCTSPTSNQCTTHLGIATTLLRPGFVSKCRSTMSIEYALIMNDNGS